MAYISYFAFTFFLSLILTFGLRGLMTVLGAVDQPKREKRKIHTKQIPLGGGLAIFLSFLAATGFMFYTGEIGETLRMSTIVGLFLGGAILMIGGFLDDKHALRPRYQLVFPILAALTIVLFGVYPDAITNPSGGVIELDQAVVPFGGVEDWIMLADIIVFFWLMGMMYTTKFLDGLDGLVGGIVAIGAFMIFFLSLQPEWFHPEVALLSLAFAGACLGFLVWNWHPAKIFLGEGGSLFTGFTLGTLAILSQGKIATTILVIGVPMLDVIRVLIRRIQKKRPVYVGDNEHLHFRLLNSGLSQRQTVLLMYAISFLFGVTTLFLQSRQKMIALIFLLVLMLLLAVWFSKEDAKAIRS